MVFEFWPNHDLRLRICIIFYADSESDLKTSPNHIKKQIFIKSWIYFLIFSEKLKLILESWKNSWLYTWLFELSESLNTLSDITFHLKICINIQFHRCWHPKYQFVCKYVKKITMENLDAFGLKSWMYKRKDNGHPKKGPWSPPQKINVARWFFSFRASIRFLSFTSTLPFVWYEFQFDVLF